MSQNSLILPTTGTVSGLQMTQNINYALDTLNTLSSGASAPASPSAGQLWHDTTNNQLKLRNLANSTWIIIGTIDETNGIFTSTNALVSSPQGRLTLTNTQPVMQSDSVAATAVYYTPYVGNSIPVYNGTAFINKTFSTLTLTLNAANHPTGQVFDVYASLQSGNVTLSAMSWGSSTSSRSPSAAGKTGTGNASITQINGLWVNNAAISVSDAFNGSTGYAIPQYQGTYLGSFYTTGNGQTTVALCPSAASGGSNNVIGLFNAYNRVNVTARSQDSTASWTYSSTTVRAANNSASNRITWIDGLQQTFYHATYTQAVQNSGAFAENIGMGVNSTTAFSSLASQSQGTNVLSLCNNYEGYPLLGLNYVQALENVPSGGTGTFYGNNYQSLTLRIQA